MGIGTPVSLGVNGNTSGSTNLTITTTSAISSGDLAFVFVGVYTNQVVSSVSDGTNSYTKAGAYSYNNGGYLNCELWYKSNCSAVSSGATITISYGGTASYWGAVAGKCTITPNPSVVDISPVWTGINGTSPSVSTGTLSNANELVLGCVYSWNTTAPTYPGAFSSLDSVTTSVNRFTGVAYDVVSSTGSVTFNPTMGSGQVVAMTMSFRATNLPLKMPTALDGLGSGGGFYRNPWGMN